MQGVIGAVCVKCLYVLHSYNYVDSPDGSLHTSNPNSVVSQTVLKEISTWMLEGCSMEDVIVRLRQRTVPPGYSYHPWIAGTLSSNSTASAFVLYQLFHLGKQEDTTDMLKSILAQFEYTARVKQYVCEGVPFNVHLHVPEIHQSTGSVLCQREDEGHLFKVNFCCIVGHMYSSSVNIFVSIN